MAYCDGYYTATGRMELVKMSISDALGSVLLLNEKHETWRPFELRDGGHDNWTSWENISVHSYWGI